MLLFSKDLSKFLAQHKMDPTFMDLYFKELHGNWEPKDNKVI